FLRYPMNVNPPPVLADAADWHDATVYFQHMSAGAGWNRFTMRVTIINQGFVDP
ncbi:hypothetical protein Tco_0848818, partial [Tanacetum coccineum]